MAKPKELKFQDLMHEFNFVTGFAEKINAELSKPSREDTDPLEVTIKDLERFSDLFQVYAIGYKFEERNGRDPDPFVMLYGKPKYQLQDLLESDNGLHLTRDHMDNLVKFAKMIEGKIRDLNVVGLPEPGKQ